MSLALVSMGPICNPRAALIEVQALGMISLAVAQPRRGKSLFDRVFNPSSFVASDGPFPKPAAHFIHPAFRQNTAASVDPAQPRLLTGLGVDLDGLAALARHLAAHLAQEAAP